MIFLNGNNILEQHQCGFRMNHSTKTALMKIVNDLRWNMDSQTVSPGATGSKRCF